MYVYLSVDLHIEAYLHAVSAYLPRALLRARGEGRLEVFALECVE